MSKWFTKTVGECLVKFPIGEKRKLKTREYRPNGRYPIIDQGQALIAGWTDDGVSLIDDNLPVVVFGDHTRSIKFVDFPFVRGADGTQVLKPEPSIDPLFFFFALQAIELPSRGYNRHLKALKECNITIPPKIEQDDVARLLKRVNDALRAQDDQLKLLQQCERAAMRVLFTRGLRGEAVKETGIGPMPESWTPGTILDLCDIRSGGTPPKSVAEYWRGDIPWVSGKDLKQSALDDTIDHISPEGADVGSRMAPAGSVLLLVRGMGLAKDLPVAVINRPMAFNQDVKALITQGEYSGSFLRSAIYVCKERLLGRIVSSAHGTMTLNLNDVENFQVPCPSTPAEAEEIVAVLDTIGRKVDLHRRKRVVLDDLFKALLHKLMTGEVLIADLDLSALPRLNSQSEPAHAHSGNIGGISE